MSSLDSCVIALAQINLTVGDLSGNVQKIEHAARQAYAQGAHILLTPELALTGYPPEDLLLRPQFLKHTEAALNQLQQLTVELSGLALVIGHPAISKENNTELFNAATVLANGEVIAQYYKMCLPNDGVFDEKRYFTPGRQPCVVERNGVRFGIAICEDAWHSEPTALAESAGAQIMLVLNASPYHVDKHNTREWVVRQRVQETGLPQIYVNLVGGQDELVFDGGSFALNEQGEIALRLPQFTEQVALLTVQQGRIQTGDVTPELPVEAQAYAALKLGVSDYIGKNGFPGVIIGLSGGVDSALVLAVAVDALGANRVRTVMMPSPYTAEISWIDARDMAARLGVQYDEIAIAQPFDAFQAALAPIFSGLPEDTTEENIQARIRGTLLMALSNKTGRLVLTTGNKSEMAVGYCTLYGDMAGGFAVIKDVVKTLVYRMCYWRNAQEGGEIIPERILTRAPSAELRPNQTDQDSLPPYEILDDILQRYVEANQSIADIVQAGHRPEDVERVTRLIKFNEYKRRQAPPGVRITDRAFGRDWRYPLTSRFRA